ncbi:MAG: hypothetical protein EBS37_17065, partial [Betaproteobacteria bacterium]|nr:hypothetical protein [Betaproteobacteria bacterium]
QVILSNPTGGAVLGAASNAVVTITDVVLGFPTKDNSVGELTIGASKHALVTKGTSAWLKNAAEDNSVVELMKKNKTMTVKTSSGKGNATTDTYALAGLGQALDRIKKECP